MQLSRYAKFANSPEEYDKLRKWVDAHNLVSLADDMPIDEPVIDVIFNTQSIDKAIKSAIDKSLDRIFKR